MNHVFNSQQLSNKALLAGHLAFHRNLEIAGEGDGDDDGNDDGDEDDDEDNKGDACDELGRLDHQEPGSFFPSCWDVSSGQPQLSSLSGGFAVSAAVALVRDFLHEEVSVRNKFGPEASSARCDEEELLIIPKTAACLEEVFFMLR